MTDQNREDTATLRQLDRVEYRLMLAQDAGDYETVARLSPVVDHLTIMAAIGGYCRGGYGFWYQPNTEAAERFGVWQPQ